jgi:prepilin-type N-terminal cleavage/methylation domain-containing protein
LLLILAVYLGLTMKRFLASTPRPQAGFTLIEVLVVVIIAAVLAGIAAPSWLGFLNRQRVSSVRSELTQTLRGAQQQAIQRRQPVNIRIGDVNGAPAIFVNDVPQVLGGESGNPGNVKLSAYSVTGGTPTNKTGISFDYQGLPRGHVVPWVVSINANESAARQCVIVANLLGTLKTADNDDCKDPNVGN